MSDLMITGVIDGPLPGGLPKAIQIYVINDIPDLSIYGLGSANNGGGTDGEEFTFPAVSASAGDIIYVASEAVEFANYLGFAPDYTAGMANINGDDAIELFQNGAVVDLFGDINVDGTGQPWEHMDGWASRDPSAGPSATFDLADWTFSGPNALDGETSNDTAASPFPTSFEPVTPTLNEIRIGQTGIDSDFVEIHAEAGASLDGLTLVVLSGEFEPGQIDFAIDLTGVTADADGFALIAEALNSALEAGDLGISGLDFFGSPSTFLLVDGFSGTAGDDLDTDNDGVLDTVPWTEVLDSVSFVDDDGNPDQSYSSTLVGPDGTFTPGGAARETDGDGAFVQLPFSDISGDTPGSTNEVEPPLPEYTIMEIQGSGHVSGLISNDPLNPTTGGGAGPRVLTSGIVTAVDTNGFYMQDPNGDGDIATSDAIFVFTGSAPAVAIGDAVSVEGTVSEFYPGGADTGNLSTTQLSGDPVVDVLSSGNALPAATIIGQGGRLLPTENIDDDGFTSFDPTTDGIDFWESMEGMLVTATDLVAVSGTSRFGEIFTVADGGADATGMSDRGTVNISPDDFNPERIQLDEDFGFSLPAVDVGAHFGDVTGVVSYDFGNYQLHPTEQVVVIEDSDLAQEVSDLVGDANHLAIASYNVLNLEINETDGDTDLADGRFDAIASQILNNLNAPDIIGLQEIQDNSGSVDDGTVSASETLQALIDAIDMADDGILNDSSGYAYIDNTFITDGASGGQPGGNIRTGFLYRTDRVQLVEGSVRTIGGQGEGEAFQGARLPIVADFIFNGEVVTVINNHLSSKGGSAPLMGTDQPFEEGQEDPDINGSLDERQAQSEAIQAYIDELLAADPDANIVVTGDFNEFEFVSPLTGLEEDLTNLTNSLTEDERYSYIFQGNSQSLDHILISEGLVDGAQFDVVHTNSEFAETADRASDHDPLLALLEIGDAPLVTVEVGVELSARWWLGTVATEIVDGAEVDTSLLIPYRDDIFFNDIDLLVDANGSASWERLVFVGGELGVRSRGEGIFSRDARLVDDDETLGFDLAEGDFGDATEVSFDFGQLRGDGQVELAFYDDGVLIETLIVDVIGGELTADLDGDTFDFVEIGAVGDTAFTLEGFTFDRVIDDPLTV